MGRKKYPLFAKFVDYMEDCCENDKIPFFPLLDPNKIKVENIGNYFTSRNFLGDNFWMWKEMRKK